MSYSTEELVQMGLDLVNVSEKEGSVLRLLGGIAYYLKAPKGRTMSQFQRNYKDLDFAVNAGGIKGMKAAFQKCGWIADEHFNSLHGATRMLFYYAKDITLQADIFISNFEQCHTLKLEKRLSADFPTLPLADLLLTKLEIHQLNQKDVLDIIMLLYDHDFGLHNRDETSSLQFILELTRTDWGWFTTVHDNLENIVDMLGAFIEKPDNTRILETIQWIKLSMEQTPKSLKWKMRNVFGRKLQWYELPEEINR